MPASLLAELDEQFCKCQSIPVIGPVSVLRGQKVLMLVSLCYRHLKKFVLDLPCTEPFLLPVRLETS